MSISVSDELQLLAQEIQKFLSPNILRDLARDVGFVQRTSKYQAKDLVALCVWVSQNVTANDLCIWDLGYFHLKDLQDIQDKEDYYISRIKSNTRMYQKNPNPDSFKDGRIKKGTEYIQIDMEVLMNSLQLGQTCEISNAYVGMTDKVPTRVIVHRLTKEQ